MRCISLLFPAILGVVLLASCKSPLSVDTPRNKVYEDSIHHVQALIPATAVTFTATVNSATWNQSLVAQPDVVIDTTGGSPRLIIRNLHAASNPADLTILSDFVLRCDSLTTDGTQVDITNHPDLGSGTKMVTRANGIGGTVGSQYTIYSDNTGNRVSLSAGNDGQAREIRCLMSASCRYGTQNQSQLTMDGIISATY
ncbi:MAG: hypothetical protein JWQ98_1161 [Chlorobi bacterium]|nr:hypothetical protein [Chlorobiota bacterium]